MPFCPKCRVEFHDWVNVCPDCSVDLVDRLPPIPKPVAPDKLVTIATFPHSAVAHVASAKLEIAGIWSFVAYENTTMYMAGQVELQVRQRDVKRAMQILGLTK